MEKEDLVDGINRRDGYECLTRLLDKIAERAEALNWDELVDMVVDQTEGFSSDDPLTAFGRVFPYLIRLCLRIKFYDEPAPFNIIRRAEIDGESGFTITNYDYDVYKFAVERGLTARLDNNRIELQDKELSEDVVQALKSCVVPSDGADR